MTTIHNHWSFEQHELGQEAVHTESAALIGGPPTHQEIWTDPITGAQGFLVIDSLVGGMTTGGTRIRAGCTLSEVADLARRMTLKTAAFGLPAGGAKAGLDIDPHHPQALEVLERFFSAMLPWIDQHWVTAEDLGLSQANLDIVFQRLGLDQSYHAAIRRSDKPVQTLERVRKGMAAQTPGGLPLGDVIGGYGVAQACLGTMKTLNWSIPNTRVAIQGIGTMGGGAAGFLHEAGIPVVAVADAAGTLHNPLGLDVPALLALRDSYGEIDRTRVPNNIERLPREAVLSLPADVLIPAAFSYAITAEMVPGCTAGVVIEAANSATTPEAEELLAVRGIPVIPDFVANAGAAAWTWWLLQGLVDSDPKQSFDQLRTQMQAKVTFMLTQWNDSNILPRRSGWDFADANHRALANTQLTVP